MDAMVDKLKQGKSEKKEDEKEVKQEWYFAILVLQNWTDPALR